MTTPGASELVNSDANIVLRFLAAVWRKPKPLEIAKSTSTLKPNVEYSHHEEKRTQRECEQEDKSLVRLASGILFCVPSILAGFKVAI